MNGGAAPPGWYPDPFDTSQLDERYWNGAEWTEATRLSDQGPPTATQAVVAAGIVGASGVPVTQQAAEQVLVSIGEISCTATTVITPNGSFPVRGTEWMVQDATSMTRRIPGYAIVLAILFALLCLIGLLFLLIQEDVYTGSVNVSVRDSAGHFFTTSVPARGANTVAEVHNRVNYCRHLAQL